MTQRIAMWSGPRNISTAMMRSWENRSDTQVVDEPFYAFYLHKTRSPHPCFEEVLQSQSNGYEQVVSELTQTPCLNKVQYQKHMTHHMLAGIDLNWVKELQHCFLIRDPAQVVNSYTNSRGECSAEDIGIQRQWELYQEITRITGQDIPIIDSNDVLKDPERILKRLCETLGVSFTPAMLTWPQGTRTSDGVWAKHWYKSVDNSSGFAPYSAKHLSLNAEQLAVVNQVKPFYQQLYDKRISA
ncbi:hypothetical protein [Paraglaciecola sp. MB-3u-78]|jgi:hypothetical protein|uniref:sulfotransferase-like domain-containing protein n=1 Tax=Paraglaciecola sp. MB-3u-78 TaxID=2058332 RepID=UPI000C325BEA|nr:hypothetical protein [Paraglaciecola sp. MB-3u-78]PKG97119.1 hypothetical protein CXF95_21185 [Paraglaciecola sp. MB-3u-78]